MPHQFALKTLQRANDGNLRVCKDVEAQSVFYVFFDNQTLTGFKNPVMIHSYYFYYNQI